MSRPLVLTAVWIVIAVSARGDEWPFGSAAKTSAFRGHDLYNLGLFGAKARDPRVPLKGDAPVPEGVQSFQIDKSGGDDGPDELIVEILFPGGPAEKAGIEVGDRIVGIAGRKFKDGSLGPIAEAIVKAEAGDGKVALSVQRENAGSRKVTIELPTSGRQAQKPTEGPGRQALLDGALKWLAEHQEQDGGFRETLSGSNGAVVQASLAGLAWLSGGSDLDAGPYRENVTKALEFVRTTLPTIESAVPSAAGGPSWNQSNWGYAHAALFLGELAHRTNDQKVRELLVECGRTLAERQEASGGWSHGPGGKNALGYLELNIVSGLALWGIGLARQVGYEVPDKVLENAEEYLKRSSSGDGGIGYSHENGKSGQGNIGRSAAAWLGYVNLGLGKNAWGKKMSGFVKKNAGDLLGGHASLMQHILLGGVAAHAQGGEAAKKYWAMAQRDLILARSPDGSFQPRPWHETLGMGSNTDVTFGEVWTTAAWAIVLGCEPEQDGRPGLPALLGQYAGKTVR